MEGQYREAIPENSELPEIALEAAETIGNGHSTDSPTIIQLIQSTGLMALRLPARERWRGDGGGGDFSPQSG
jgi:hypothetical protein